MTMTMNKARACLFLIFFVCFLVQLAAYLSVENKMWLSDFELLLRKLVGIYSVPLGVILAGVFARPKGSQERPLVFLAYVANALALLWNLLFLWKSIAFTLRSEGSASELIKYMDVVSSFSSWLVTGTLTFFFIKETQIGKLGRQPVSR